MIPYPNYPNQQPDFGQAPPQLAAKVNLAPIEIAKPRAGMFGGKGKAIGEMLMGALNGYLAGMGNQAGLLGLQQMHQRKMDEARQAQAQQEYERSRADKRGDFVFEQDYRAAHPAPQQPGEFERALMGSGVMPGTPQWAEAMKRKAELALNPVVMTAYGPVPYSTVAGAQQPQPAPQGVTFTPLPEEGGQTPPASGNFSY